MTFAHRLLVLLLPLAALPCARQGLAAPADGRSTDSDTTSRSAPTPNSSAPGTPAGSGLVLLIAERPDDPFLERIKAELVAIGFTTVTRRNDVPLERAAREVSAVAAIRVLPSRQGVEVWMADRTSGRSLLRQVIVDENPSGPNQSVIALQTAELLRTSLLEQQAAPPASSAGHGPPPTPPTPPEASFPPTKDEPATPVSAAGTPPPSAGLQAALGALYSPGGSTPALQLWLSLQRSFSQNVALAIDLSAPLLNASRTLPEGTTRIGTYVAGIAFLLQTRSQSGRFFANGGAGLGAMRLAVAGETSAPLVSRSVGVTSVAGYIRSDVGAELAPWLRLGARAIAGATPEKLEITVAGNEGGSWGRFYAGAFFLAEVPWR
ncbi:MAG TPA: hypothetical protein VFQ61_26355 [Polyangiaceae bacterium]|nr:hypothetical protein [Polyangiaceae bacterium]